MLEARQRIGGRIWTSNHWQDAPIDLGAAWIHGSKGNPIAELAAKINAAAVTTSYDRGMIYDTSGRELSDAEEVHLRQLRKQIDNALGNAQNLDADQSVQSAVDADRKKTALAPEENSLVNFVLNGGIEHEFAGSTEKLSAYWFDEAEAFDGEDLQLVNGFQEIITHLAQGVSIKLGQTVRELRWGSGQVVVVTDQGDYSAERVVVTLPLGVLKKGAVRFNPELPAKNARPSRRSAWGCSTNVA